MASRPFPHPHSRKPSRRALAARNPANSSVARAGARHAVATANVGEGDGSGGGAPRETNDYERIAISEASPSVAVGGGGGCGLSGKKLGQGRKVPRTNLRARAASTLGKPHPPPPPTSTRSFVSCLASFQARLPTRPCKIRESAPPRRINSFARTPRSKPAAVKVETLHVARAMKKIPLQTKQNKKQTRRGCVRRNQSSVPPPLPDARACPKPPEHQKPETVRKKDRRSASFKPLKQGTQENPTSAGANPPVRARADRVPPLWCPPTPPPQPRQPAPFPAHPAARGRRTPARLLASAPRPPAT